MTTLGEQLNAAHAEVDRLERLILTAIDDYPAGTVLRGSYGNAAMDVVLFKIDGEDTRDGNVGGHFGIHWVSIYDDFSGQSFVSLGDAKSAYGDMRSWVRLGTPVVECPF